ncbi:hypothetical protein TNIN_27661 [Trichonephila inaurata madagascariensis]|uniref:Uncharacterized protein n=1 Tax=Trichonephila inaurata madagascariensis TaxID=2747483 RepID=A0A8X6YEW3_9ARAC|nr:hypothetical protein TNIN_27661 [Trichonephila inaurata madagascariensis]
MTHLRADERIHYVEGYGQSGKKNKERFGLRISSRVLLEWGVWENKGTFLVRGGTWLCAASVNTSSTKEGDKMRSETSLSTVCPPAPLRL